MLILDHDVLEVVLGSFMDHLRPAINGMCEFLSLAENKRITFAFFLSFFLSLQSKDVFVTLFSHLPKHSLGWKYMYQGGFCSKLDSRKTIGRLIVFLIHLILF